MLQTWKYLENQFLSRTEKNFEKALILAEFTDAALHSRIADAFFNAQYSYFHPLYDAYLNAYTKWHAQKGQQQGMTASVAEVIEKLRAEKINFWDAAVQTAGIAKGSANYVALFPNRHNPFQRGSALTRIGAVASLSTAIAKQIPAGAPPTHPLVVLKVDVDTFYTMANETYKSQQGEISGTGGNSRNVNAVRKKAMTGLYAVLGACMNKFAENPKVIASLFDLETLRQHKQMIFQRHVKANSVHTIVQRTFTENDKLKLANHGVTLLKFYLSEHKDGHASPTVTPVEVAAGLEVTVPIAPLGGIANHFLMVFNPDLVNKGEFVVEVV